MHRTILLLIACCALLSISSFAQNLPACSPVGTWYGGSQYKYEVTISPITGGRYSIVGNADFDYAGFGYKAATSYFGEVDKLPDGRYTGQIIQLYTTSSEVPPPEDSVGLNAVRQFSEFTGDCDHMTWTIDFFVAYFDLNKIPFVDAPDLSYLPPGGKIVETYRRMPTTCPACPLSVLAPSQPRQGR